MQPDTVAVTPRHQQRTPASPTQANVAQSTRGVLAPDEMQASAGARSAPASLLHRYEKEEDELAPLLATSTSKLRRLRDLADYMGYCANRGEDPVIARVRPPGER